MLTFFTDGTQYYAVESAERLTPAEKSKLEWAFSGAQETISDHIAGPFIGPRKEMITPWSTNAVEIAWNMGIPGVTRIETFRKQKPREGFDPMLQAVYPELNPDTFTDDRQPEDVVYIDDIHEYNLREGLALSPEEEDYLSGLAKRLGRPLTDSEVFGFSQVNSEHCRHKIFNGTFVIDGEEMPESLFGMIKKTSKTNPNGLVSAYKDNVAFVKGPKAVQFAPEKGESSSYFAEKEIPTVLSLKAETHNFPTTVEPFNGAATGTGGEIRDRLGGGKASLPLAGTAVYMTSYPRINGKKAWEMAIDPRVWLYQTPAQILVKASNGASDFGNKFGQPLICGSLLTFETQDDGKIYAYDKVIMLAGGVGFATEKDAIKGIPEPGQAVVVSGGDNYRIGMGGGAVSSVDTGKYANAIELNAVQRANPEMQKRVSNVIRALAESDNNPIVSVHDHGAGGHLNALSELVEATGGKIMLDKLPVGDKTLSAKEIVGNESQERMGFVINPESIPLVEQIASRERAPMYVVGETTGDDRFVFERNDGSKPIDLAMSDMFGSSPKTVMEDSTVERPRKAVNVSEKDIPEYLNAVLSLESVGCKDWLTNKVDRSVTGKVTRQQCTGALQLPLNDCAIASLDYTGTKGIATSIGHAPGVALREPAKASTLAVAEALTNICTAPLKDGLKSVSLSANWMWPCRNEGRDADLYKAVKACSDFTCGLGINIPTGKDSLSMTQKYPDGKSVQAPGTVIISAAAETEGFRNMPDTAVNPRLTSSKLYYVDFSAGEMVLGGSALEQVLGHYGEDAPAPLAPEKFAAAFNAVQRLVKEGLVTAAHDVSAGGLVTCLLEMCFSNTVGGFDVDLSGFGSEANAVNVLFAENPALVIQVTNSKIKAAGKILEAAGVRFFEIGTPAKVRQISISANGNNITLDINALREAWRQPSNDLEPLQTAPRCAALRARNAMKQPLKFKIPSDFKGTFAELGLPVKKRVTNAAIIREKGVNGDREMAYSLYLAGFNVKDVHMTDLMEGREDLKDVNMIVFCGGFSHSDVLGSAKGWASGFRYSPKAKKALEDFYARPDTLSLGVCNGCQLMVELGLLGLGENLPAKMAHNLSGKFESAFLSVEIPENNSVMLRNLAGCKTGIWVAHGEGRFVLDAGVEKYPVAMKYAYASYPGNPNGSVGSVAGLVSHDGRHLAVMPHLERAIFPWQCANYPDARRLQDATLWLKAFVNARRWCEAQL